MSCPRSRRRSASARSRATSAARSGISATTSRASGTAPRVGPDREAARQLAAQINAQLEVGAPAALSFEPVSVPELRRRWLEHHEQVLRSSVQTISRYRTATDHLLRFLEQRPVRHASHLHASHAEEFVRYLRQLRVSPNGHANTPTRPLMDKGLRYVLECCRALFNYAGKRRHLSPYAENPFASLEIDRIPSSTPGPSPCSPPGTSAPFWRPATTGSSPCSSR